MNDLMNGVFIHHLRFDLRAREIVSFGPQPGSALRGALYNALSRQYCPDQDAAHLPGHRSACPVCRLLAAEDPDGQRGHDLPRPLTIEPPTADLCVESGQGWQFGLSLIGQGATETFPHLIRAVQAMGQEGVGHGRGRFELVGVEACNPLSREQVSLLDGRRVELPAIPVTADQVKAAASALPGDRLALRLITPLRIGEDKRLCRQPALAIFIRRLLERCQAIATHYGSDPAAQDRAPWRELSLRLSETAASARLSTDQTRWLDIQSGSWRTGQATPIGGLVGTAVWEGNLQEMLPWVTWGQSLHVGKDTVKGNGWYAIVDPKGFENP